MSEGMFQSVGRVPITDLMPRGYAPPATVPSPEPVSPPAPVSDPAAGAAPSYSDPAIPDVVVNVSGMVAKLHDRVVVLTPEEVQDIIAILLMAESRQHSEWQKELQATYGLQQTDSEGTAVRPTE